MNGSDSLYSATLHKSQATDGIAISADINLITECAALLAANTSSPVSAAGRACRQIRVGVGGGGTLKVKLAGGTEDTYYNVQDGDVINCQATKIFGTASATTVTKFTVHW